MLARMMLDCDSFQKWAMRLGDLMSFCTAWKAHLFLSFEAILICSGDFASRLVKFLTTLFSYWRSLSARLSSDLPPATEGRPALQLSKSLGSACNKSTTS